MAVDSQLTDHLAVKYLLNRNRHGHSFDEDLSIIIGSDKEDNTAQEKSTFQTIYDMHFLQDDETNDAYEARGHFYIDATDH